MTLKQLLKRLQELPPETMNMKVCAANNGLEVVNVVVDKEEFSHKKKIWIEFETVNF